MRKNLLMLCATVLIFSCMSWAKTLVGVVSDASCGVKHARASKAAAECVKKCEDGGTKLTLVSHGKVYNTDDQDKLKGYEGQLVRVTGEVNGDTITIASVEKGSGHHMMMRKKKSSSGTGK